MEAERENRRREPAGQPLKEPLYDMEDAGRIVTRMEATSRCAWMHFAGLLAKYEKDIGTPPLAVALGCSRT